MRSRVFRLSRCSGIIPDNSCPLCSPRAAPNTFFYMSVVFVVSYGVKELGFTQIEMLGAVCIGAAAEVVTLPFFGSLCDRVGRRKNLCRRFGVSVLDRLPVLLRVANEVVSPAGAWLCRRAPHRSLGSTRRRAFPFSEMFPARVRFTGLSAAYQTSGAMLAGPPPIIATLLIASQGVRLFAAYTVVVGIISVIAIMAGTPHHSLLSAKGARRQVVPAQ